MAIVTLSEVTMQHALCGLHMHAVLPYGTLLQSAGQCESLSGTLQADVILLHPPAGLLGNACVPLAL